MLFIRYDVNTIHGGGEFLKDYNPRTVFPAWTSLRWQRYLSTIWKQHHAHEVSTVSRYRSSQCIYLTSEVNRKTLQRYQCRSNSLHSYSHGKTKKDKLSISACIVAIPVQCFCWFSIKAVKKICHIFIFLTDHKIHVVFVE